MYNVPFQEQHKHNHVKPVNSQGDSLDICGYSAAEGPIHVETLLVNHYHYHYIIIITLANFRMKCKLSQSEKYERNGSNNQIHKALWHAQFLEKTGAAKTYLLDYKSISPWVFRQVSQHFTFVCYY